MSTLHLWNSERPALVDDDLAHLARLRWRLDKRGYVIRYSERRVRLSHQVMGKPPVGFVCNYISRDKLDNRRANLRIIPTSANAQNRSAHKCNVTGLRGVWLRPDTGRYLAHARLDGKNHRLGYYDTPEEAGAVAKKFRLEHMPYTVEA
jgi:hypothetical protein